MEKSDNQKNERKILALNAQSSSFLFLALYQSGIRRAVSITKM